MATPVKRYKAKCEACLRQLFHAIHGHTQVSFNLYTLLFSPIMHQNDAFRYFRIMLMPLVRVNNVNGCYCAKHNKNMFYPKTIQTINYNIKLQQREQKLKKHQTFEIV